jgi:hypothetical protein
MEHKLTVQNTEKILLLKHSYQRSKAEFYAPSHPPPQDVAHSWHHGY